MKSKLSDEFLKKGTESLKSDENIETNAKEYNQNKTKARKKRCCLIQNPLSAWGYFYQEKYFSTKGLWREGGVGDQTYIGFFSSFF